MLIVAYVLHALGVRGLLSHLGGLLPHFGGGLLSHLWVFLFFYQISRTAGTFNELLNANRLGDVAIVGRHWMV